MKFILTDDCDRESQDIVGDQIICFTVTILNKTRFQLLRLYIDTKYYRSQ